MTPRGAAVQPIGIGADRAGKKTSEGAPETGAPSALTQAEGNDQGQSGFGWPGVPKWSSLTLTGFPEK